MSVSLEEVVFFLRKDKLLLLGEAKESVEELEEMELNLFAFVSENASYQYYEDDGISTKENGVITTITVTRNGEMDNGNKKIGQVVVIAENRD